MKADATDEGGSGISEKSVASALIGVLIADASV
jgi:hypothetical protein